MLEGGSRNWAISYIKTMQQINLSFYHDHVILMNLSLSGQAGYLSRLVDA